MQPFRQLHALPGTTQSSHLRRHRLDRTQRDGQRCAHHSHYFSSSSLASASRRVSVRVPVHVDPAAVIDAETNDLNGVRRIAVGPGVYTERVTLSASTGSTFAELRRRSSDPLVSIVRIYPPADSVVAPTSPCRAPPRSRTSACRSARRGRRGHPHSGRHHDAPRTA